jgi:hypothetical protein
MIKLDEEERSTEMALHGNKNINIAQTKKSDRSLNLLAFIPNINLPLIFLITYIRETSRQMPKYTLASTSPTVRLIYANASYVGVEIINL